MQTQLRLRFFYLFLAMFLSSCASAPLYGQVDHSKDGGPEPKREIKTPVVPATMACKDYLERLGEAQQKWEDGNGSWKRRVTEYHQRIVDTRAGSPEWHQALEPVKEAASPSEKYNSLLALDQSSEERELRVQFIKAYVGIPSERAFRYADAVESAMAAWEREMSRFATVTRFLYYQADEQGPVATRTQRWNESIELVRSAIGEMISHSATIFLYAEKMTLACEANAP